MKRVRKVFATLLMVSLVGIAIILWLPACGCESKESAMAAACLANLKQIDLASIMYENDYDDHGPGRLWSTQIKPYLKELHETDKVLHDLSPVGIKFGYAMNRKVVNLDSASVKEPNQLITFFDSTADAPHAVADLGTLPFPGRHKGRNNVAYADGHVKRLLSARSK